MFEHLFHFFGGGCGEHLALPILGSLLVTLGLARVALKARWRGLVARFRRPASFTHRGKLFVDGKDYFGEDDRQLIEAHGVRALNFRPSTPPAYR